MFSFLSPLFSSLFSFSHFFPSFLTLYLFFLPFIPIYFFPSFHFVLLFSILHSSCPPSFSFIFPVLTFISLTRPLYSFSLSALHIILSIPPLLSFLLLMFPFLSSPFFFISRAPLSSLRPKSSVLSGEEELRSLPAS